MTRTPPIDTQPGLYTVNGTPLFISRGIASIGLPVRLFCLPEVPLLRLVAAP